MHESNGPRRRKAKSSNGVVPVRLYKPMARSKVTNGVDLLPGTDQRTVWARRFRDIRALFLSDMAGETHCSEGEKALVRRCATLVVELERMEATFARNGASTPLQFEQYQRGANTLRRLLKALGPRRAKPVPDLYRDVLPALANKHAAPNGGDGDPA